MTKLRLSTFQYRFNCGPVSPEKLAQPLTEGNCRTALQEYFYVAHGIYLTSEEILNPRGYRHTGKFIKQGFSPDFFAGLPNNAVIYAEPTKNKYGLLIDRSRDNFDSEDQYLIALHTAVYVGNLARVASILPEATDLPDHEQTAIWHATAIEGNSCLWSLKRFQEYYNPVAAKQFI